MVWLFKWLVVVVVASLVGLGLGVGAGHAWMAHKVSPPRGEAARPAVVIDRTFHDVGVVTAGEICGADFKVKNEGTARLILWDEGACGCGKGDEAAIVVSPGQTGKVPVDFDTTGLRGPSQRVAHYRTNDPALPRLKLTLSVVVEVP
jgi:hypothetical protein